MPRILDEKKLKHYREMNDLRRNLKMMTKEEQEMYASSGKSLREILGNRYLDKDFRWNKRKGRPKLKSGKRIH